MFIEVTDNEIVNLKRVEVIRKVYDTIDKNFKIYVNTGSDVVTLRFNTEEELNRTWEWLRRTVPMIKAGEQE